MKHDKLFYTRIMSLYLNNNFIKTVFDESVKCQKDALLCNIYENQNVFLLKTCFN